MTINLLPSEEKARIKKEKQARQPLIQMTGASELAQKQKPAVRGGGVLSFIKQAFRRPKKQLAGLAGEEKALPEKKILLEEKIVFKPLKEKIKPRIEYAKPVVPVFKPVQSPEKKQRGFFAWLFKRKESAPIRLEKKKVFTPLPAEEGFPKFQPVKAEKIEPKPAPKSRQPEVIRVTTQEFRPAKSEPERPVEASPQKEKHEWKNIISTGPFKTKAAVVAPIKKAAAKSRGPSVLRRLINWWKKIFTRKPKPILFDFPIKAAKIGPEEIKKDPVKKKDGENKIVTQFIKPVAVMPPPRAELKKEDFGPAPEGSGTRLSASEKKEEALKLTQPAETATGPAGFGWEVNLVPEEALEHEIPVSKILYIALAAIISATFVFAAWFILNWSADKKMDELNTIDNQITEQNEAIRQYKQLQEEMKALKENLGNVQTILDKHVYWSQLFAQLEQYTIPEVYFSGMTADVNGSVTLTAYAKNYDSAVKQLYVFKKADDFTSGATISSITLAGSSTSTPNRTLTNTEIEQTTVSDQPVTFTITLTVLPIIFYLPH